MMRVAILISGRGSNMLRLADVIDSSTNRAQFILVALPEEYFYRGYLQTTLDDAMPQRARWWIFHLSPAILITSVLFGVGHFIIDLRPARMSVFFPSLLFGWLRDHTGTIVSCVVYHAACNLMVEAATHHYF